MATKKRRRPDMPGHKYGGYAYWQCEKCGAWVFVMPQLHGAVCGEYVKDPGLVAEAEAHYKYLIGKEQEDLLNPKPKRTSRAKKNTAV